MSNILDQFAFLNGERPSNDLPAFISTSNARDLSGYARPNVVEAIARHRSDALDVRDPE